MHLLHAYPDNLWVSLVGRLTCAPTFMYRCLPLPCTCFSWSAIGQFMWAVCMMVLKSIEGCVLGAWWSRGWREDYSHQAHDSQVAPQWWVMGVGEQLFSPSNRMGRTLWRCACTAELAMRLASCCVLLFRLLTAYLTYRRDVQVFVSPTPVTFERF
jgi:hypothetical protein